MSSRRERLDPRTGAARLRELADWLEGAPKWVVSLWECRWTDHSFEIRVAGEAEEVPPEAESEQTSRC